MLEFFSGIFLNCEGLDTVASIELNGQEIGRSDNMFRRYRFDIGKNMLMLSEANVLRLSFQSPIKYARQKYEEQSQDYVVPPPCTFPQGDCHANHIRKMQSSFG